jgi:isopentenyl phosphate kinase
MTKKKLILIKLGGSVITDKTKEFTVKSDVISRLAKETYDIKKRLGIKMIIGHGAGSFAHVPATKYRTKEGFINKESLYGMCITSDAARELNRLVTKEFLKQKVPVFSFSPGSIIVSSSQIGKKPFLGSLSEALDRGIVPVVYGDVILDIKQGCTIFSTEKVFASLVSELKNSCHIKIISLTDVDGVYDGDGKVIEKITPKNFSDLKKSIMGSKKTDVTGGMLHKVEEALKLAQKYNIKTHIINGNKRGYLSKAVYAKRSVNLGTVIEA